ncbi:putative bifunctional diguanylate cyclase/phosphodiesterase [Fusibacter ferrireducens]|uniref:GGDEF and EAL domain-containing protein n=1 Tax=Fusibacter ferrireducens TaxID=2785058 RepID=A0ABR9ZPN8_9FIRM|nr:GGDEF and EAL domain-containing protein [Fusibacter ferrireducens]MBF4692412.1 GGDEF and EAL domain-containing protein [Fusibacter ferrireducens]
MIKINLIDRDHIFEIPEARSDINSISDNYNLLLEDSVDDLWNWHVKDQQISVSVRHPSHLGIEMEREQFTLDSWKNKIHPQDREDAERVWTEFINLRQEKYKNLYRVINRDGQYKWLLSRGRAIKNDRGEIVHIIGYHIDVTEKYTLKKELYCLAHYDQLTQLSNKDKLKRDFELTIKNLKLNSEIAFIQIDIDNFGYINNTLGHEIGYELIKNFATFLSKRYRHQHSVARINEDEFLIIYEFSGGINELEKELAEVLYESKNMCFMENSEVRISCSIGVSIYEHHGQTFHDLIGKSSTALHSAKENLKDQYVIYSQQLGSSVYYNMHMINQIRKGLEEESFEMYYQPIVYLKTGKLTSLEALIRWNHLGKGFISPESFIPIAENSGQIIALEKWIFENVFKQIKTWTLSGSLDIKFSINMSAKGLVTGDLIVFLESLLRKYPIDPSIIDFEVTETAVFKNIDYTLAVLEKLKGLGFGLTLDDFGVGYSSLSYLSILPIDKVKLDRKFISNIERSRRDFLLVKSIIDTAHNLNLEIVAEGIENNSQVELLNELNCDYIQGYHFGRPQDAELTGLFIHKKWADKKLL